MKYPDFKLDRAVNYLHCTLNQVVHEDMSAVDSSDDRDWAARHEVLTKNVMNGKNFDENFLKEVIAKKRSEKFAEAKRE